MPPSSKGKLPVPGTPPEPLRNGEGVSELSREVPAFTVRLNAGEFMWLWRMVEAKAILHYNNPSTKLMVPQQVKVALGAVRAFRQAAGTIMETEPMPPRLKIFGKIPPKKTTTAPTKKLFGGNQ